MTDNVSVQRRISFFVESVSDPTDNGVVVSGEVGLGPLHVGDIFAGAVHERDESPTRICVGAIRVNDASAEFAEAGTKASLDLDGAVGVIGPGDILVGETDLS